MHAAAGLVVVAHGPQHRVGGAAVADRYPDPVLLRDDLDVQRIVRPGVTYGVGDDLADQQAGDLGVLLAAPGRQDLVDQAPGPPGSAGVGGKIEACGKSFGHASTLHG